MAVFRDCLELCEVSDLGFSGVPFTYDNKRAGRRNVRVRLDRAVADMAWRDIFADASVTHLVSPCSDHCPVLVQIVQEQQVQNKRRCRQYELFWERASELSEIIAAAWDQAGVEDNLCSIQNCLQKVMSSLQTWCRKKFGNIVRELDVVRKELEQLLSTQADQQEVRRVTDRMNELLYKEKNVVVAAFVS